MGDALREKHEDVVTLLATVSGGKVMLAAACGKASLARGAHAGKLVKAIATMVGGGGGGRPDSATAGGRDASKLASALEAAAETLKGMLK